MAASKVIQAKRKQTNRQRIVPTIQSASRATTRASARQSLELQSGTAYLINWCARVALHAQQREQQRGALSAAQGMAPGMAQGASYGA